MGKNTAKEHTIIVMEISTLDNGLRIRRTETEFFSTRQALCTMDNGLMIRPQIRGKSSTQIKTNMKETS